MIQKFSHPETEVIHAGIPEDAATGAVNVPIYQTSTFHQPELGRTLGYEYARTGNPTRKALEALIADLEKGTAGFAFASGMAALTTALSLFKSGDEILISENVYGGTFRVLDKVFRNFGITYRIADTTDATAFAQELSPATKAVLIESPANPLLSVTDIAAIASLAKAAAGGCPLFSAAIRCGCGTGSGRQWCQSSGRARQQTAADRAGAPWCRRLS